MKHLHKRNLFFDFDDTKFKTVESLVLFINDFYGINSVRADYANMNERIDEVIKMYDPSIPLTRSEIYAELNKNFHAELFHQDRIKPLPNMVEVMKQLAEKYNIYTVTARPDIGIKMVKHLLDKHIPGCITHVHNVHKSNGDGTYIKHHKVDFIKSMKGENVAFVDDSPDEVRLAKDHIDSFLFDPHNLHPHSKGITKRFYSWEEIGKKFL